MRGPRQLLTETLLYSSIYLPLIYFSYTKTIQKPHTHLRHTDNKTQQQQKQTIPLLSSSFRLPVPNFAQSARTKSTRIQRFILFLDQSYNHYYIPLTDHPHLLLLDTS
jgi:hypothetical protein